MAVGAVGAFALPSCGGSRSAATVAAPAAPAPQDAQWIASVIGGAPDASIVARPMAARSDAHWGPLINRVLFQRDKGDDFISHGSGVMVLTSQQIDMHFAVRDPIAWGDKNSKADLRAVGWIGLIYGLAPMDPLMVRTGSGRPLFAPPVRLYPSGVVMYPPDQANVREYGVLAPTLFVTPSGTCVVTEQGSAPRAQGMLAMNGFAPPPLAAAPDALAGVRFAVTSMRFLNATPGERAGVTQGMFAAVFGLRGGQNGAIEGYGDYATEDDAARGYSALQRTCAQRKNECLIDPSLVRDAKAELEGSRIYLTMSLSDKLLQSLKAYDPYAR